MVHQSVSLLVLLLSPVLSASLGCAGSLPPTLAAKVVYAAGARQPANATPAVRLHSAATSVPSAPAQATLVHAADAGRSGRWRESRALCHEILCGRASRRKRHGVGALIEQPRCAVARATAGISAAQRDSAVWMLARASIAVGDVKGAREAFDALVRVDPNHVAAARQRRRIRRLEARIERATTLTSNAGFDANGALGALGEAAIALDALALRVFDGGAGFSLGHAKLALSLRAGAAADADAANGVRAALALRVKISVLECRARARWTQGGDDAFAEAQRACGAARDALGVLRAVARQSDIECAAEGSCALGSASAKVTPLRAWSDSDEAAHVSRVSAVHAATAGAYARDGAFDAARKSLRDAARALDDGVVAIAASPDADAAAMWGHGPLRAADRAALQATLTPGRIRVVVQRSSKARRAAVERFATRAGELRAKQEAIESAERKRKSGWNSKHFERQASALRITPGELRDALRVGGEHKARCRLVKSRYNALAVKWHPDKVKLEKRAPHVEDSGVSSTRTWLRLDGNGTAAVLAAPYRTPRTERVARATHKFREVLEAKQELDDEWGCARGGRAGEGRKARSARRKEEGLRQQRERAARNGAQRGAQSRRAQQQAHHRQRQARQRWRYQQQEVERRRRDRLAQEEIRNRRNPRAWAAERARRDAHANAERQWRDGEARDRAAALEKERRSALARARKFGRAKAKAAEAKLRAEREAQRAPGWTASLQDMHSHWEEQRASFMRWRAPSQRARARKVAANTARSIAVAAFAKHIAAQERLYAAYRAAFLFRARAHRAVNGRWPPQPPKRRRQRPKAQATKPKRKTRRKVPQRKRETRAQRRKRAQELKRSGARRARATPEGRERAARKSARARKERALEADAVHRLRAAKARAREALERVRERERVERAEEDRWSVEERQRRAAAERDAAQGRFDKRMAHEASRAAQELGLAQQQARTALLREQRHSQSAAGRAESAARAGEAAADARKAATWVRFAAKKRAKMAGSAF